MTAGDTGEDRVTEQEVDVDLVLERDLSSVVSAVHDYLGNPTEELRNRLLGVLEHLDDQIELSDLYARRLRLPPTGTAGVVGATSDNPMAEEVPSFEFQAQVTLVKAAKAEVLAPTPANLEDLRAAAAAFEFQA